MNEQHRKRRRSLRLVLEFGPGDGLEVTILYPRCVNVSPPDELPVKPENGRCLVYDFHRQAGRRAVYRPRKSPAP